MSYSMSIRSRAAKTRSGAGAAFGPTSTRPWRCAGISTPASASTVGARSMKLTSSSRTEPGVAGRPERLRPPDHQRHAEARVVERSLGARDAVAVIAPVEDDRVVGQPVVFELLQDLADLRVHVGDVVVDAGELFAHDRRVGVVRRHLELRRIGDERLALARRARRKNLALVRHLEVEHREERLALVRAVAPVRVAARGRPRW